MGREDTVSGVEIVAHRGASADAPENTVEAFDLALEQGADVLEIDLQMTADRRLVALHDPTLERTHGDPRAVGELTVGDLEVARLGALLSAYAGRARFLLDLKEPRPPMERRLLRAIRNADAQAAVTVQSFDMRSLRRIRRLDPAIAVAALADDMPARPVKWLDRAQALGAVAVGLPRAGITRRLVRAAHERGLRIRAYTVNGPAEARRFARWGVDGLITDRPAAIRAALADRVKT
jgi:glycerophosphoryl diester phosphodiesterase